MIHEERSSLGKTKTEIIKLQNDYKRHFSGNVVKLVTEDRFKS